MQQFTTFQIIIIGMTVCSVASTIMDGIVRIIVGKEKKVPSRNSYIPVSGTNMEPPANY